VGEQAQPLSNVAKDFQSLSTQEQAEDVRSRIPEELRTANAERNTLRDELNASLPKLQDYNAYPLGSQQRRELEASIRAAQIRSADLDTQIKSQEGQIYERLFTDLRAENPQQVRVTTSDAKISADQAREIERYIGLASGIAESNGTVLDVTLQTYNGTAAAVSFDGRTFYVPTVQTSAFGGGSSKAVAMSPSTIVHETMHILQAQIGYGIKATDEFVASRTKGEKLQSLVKLEPTTGEAKSVKAYKDAVDSPYTLRSYPGHTVEFAEVLSMAVSNISNVATAKDKGLFEWFLNTVKKGGK